MATLSNEQKIKIKFLNNSASYSVNEELIDLQTVKTMQYSPPWSPSVLTADTPVCNIDDSIQDIPPVPVVDTPACDNNNSSIQDIPSPLSDTVSPQQTPVTLKSLNKSCSDMYSQLIAIKEFLLNEICILRKEVYTNKDRMEHLIPSLQDKNKITELTIKVSLLEEENLKLRNQIIENHITIGKMQNISNTGKDSQAKPVELNMTKLVNNGETLTLDSGSITNNEPLSKKPICSKSIEEQMAEFKNKNHEKYMRYKRNSAKTDDKDESIQSPICISETGKNDNGASDNSEDGPWPKGTICITGDSILSGPQPGLLSQKRKVKVKTFSGANVRDMHDNRKPILRHIGTNEAFILHIGTNEALNLPPNEILDKILELKKRSKR